MRQKYDQGEDPLDPENGQGGGGGGHPFRHGGHTFHFPGCPLFFYKILILNPKVAIRLEGGSSSSTSTSKIFERLLHRFLDVIGGPGASQRHLTAGTDLRAFTQISQVASLIVIQLLSYCRGTMRWGGEIKRIKSRTRWRYSNKWVK